MKTESIYVSAESGEYITFNCGKCEKEAKLVTIRPDEPNPSTDLKNIHILGLEVECPECGQEGFFKMSLGGAEAKGVGG
jgi:DNA-directed RNA polymerase subunit RPC12/RpoP